MNTKAWLVAALLALPTAPALAQTTGPLLLSGMTYGLPWGVYAGGLTNLQDGVNQLRLSAPEGAQVLGTTYQQDQHRAVLTYRPPTLADARAALDFAVQQLTRQGYTLTYRTPAGPDPQHLRALLRRTDRLMEVQVDAPPAGSVEVTYTFRNPHFPDRLLPGQAPPNWHVYAAPINLKVMPAQPGQVFLTPPRAVLIDFARFEGNGVILAFYGNDTMDQLADDYTPFFERQGFFVQETGREPDQHTRTYRLRRDGQAYRLTLAGTTPTDALNRSIVTLQQQGPG